MVLSSQRPRPRNSKPAQTSRRTSKPPSWRSPQNGTVRPATVDGPTPVAQRRRGHGQMPDGPSRFSDSQTPASASARDHGSTDASGDVVPSPRRSWEFARVDLLRGYRWVRYQDFWLAFTALMGVLGAFFLWQTFDAARTVGSEVAAGAAFPSWLVTATGVLWLFLTILLVTDALGSNGDLDNDGQYLTLCPAADVVGGLLLAATTKFSVYTLGPGLAAGAGLAAGTGSLRPLL